MKTTITVHPPKGPDYTAEMNLPSCFFDERKVFFCLEKVGEMYVHTLLSRTDTDRGFNREATAQVPERYYVFHNSDECADLIRITKAEFEAEVISFLQSELKLRTP